MTPTLTPTPVHSLEVTRESAGGGWPGQRYISTRKSKIGCPVQAKLERGFSFLREYEHVVPNLSPLPIRDGRLDVDSTYFACCIVTVAAPGPVLRPLD